MQNRIDQLESALCKALNLLTDHGIDNDLPEDIAELWAVYSKERIIPTKSPALYQQKLSRIKRGK